MAFPDSFETARLRAERLRPEDLAEIRRMHVNALVMAELGGVRTEEQTAAYLARNLKHWDEYGFGLWVLFERQGAEPIGRAVLRHLSVDGVDDVEVGYAFYQPFWGQGLATEVTAACLIHAREALGLETVVAITSPNNHASQHVLRKNGLRFDRQILYEGAPCALFRVTWRSSKAR